MPSTVQSSRDAERPRILLIEHNDEVRRALQLLLNGWGFEVRSFATPTLALTDPSLIEATVLLLDEQFIAAEANAHGVLPAMRTRGWQGRAILMSAAPEDARNGVAGRAGFAAVIRNPPRQLELLAALGR